MASIPLFKLDNVAELPPLESKAVAPNPADSKSTTNESFDDHLQSARYVPDDSQKREDYTSSEQTPLRAKADTPTAPSGDSPRAADGDVTPTDSDEQSSARETSQPEAGQDASKETANSEEDAEEIQIVVAQAELPAEDTGEEDAEETQIIVAQAELPAEDAGEEDAEETQIIVAQAELPAEDAIAEDQQVGDGVQAVKLPANSADTDGADEDSQNENGKGANNADTGKLENKNVADSTGQEVTERAGETIEASLKESAEVQPESQAAENAAATRQVNNVGGEAARADDGAKQVSQTDSPTRVDPKGAPRIDGGAPAVEKTITEDEGLSKGNAAVQEQQLPGQENKTQVDAIESSPSAHAKGEVADMPKPSQRTVREKKGAEPPRHAASSDRMPGVQHAVAEADANGAVRQAETLAVSTRTSGELSEQLSNADISTVRPAASGSGENQSNEVVRELTGQPQRAGAATQTKADEPGQVDGARFVQRVARAFRAVGDRGGNVRLRLSPPELGSLRLDISVRNGAMTAKVEAETATARNLLLDNLPALRERLAEQNIKVEQFDVSLSDRSPGGLPDQTARHAEDRRQGQGGGNSQLHGEGENEEQMSPESHLPNRPGEGAQLNVVV